MLYSIRTDIDKTQSKPDDEKIISMFNEAISFIKVKFNTYCNIFEEMLFQSALKFRFNNKSITGKDKYYTTAWLYSYWY